MPVRIAQNASGYRKARAVMPGHARQSPQQDTRMPSKIEIPPREFCSAGCRMAVIADDGKHAKHHTRAESVSSPDKRLRCQQDGSDTANQNIVRYLLKVVACCSSFMNDNKKTIRCSTTAPLNRALQREGMR